MAGYSKGIVDTRKLNKDSKAKLGRGGDTKIREVDNRASHVNALEAYLIDVNGKAGEEYAKRVGAGTVNPLTGMPEYQTEGEKIAVLHGDGEEFYGYYTYTDGEWVKTGGGSGSGSGADGDKWYQGWDDPKLQNIDLGSKDPYSYEGLSDVTGEQLKTFDPNLGADDVKYFQDIFTDVPFGFLGEQQDLTIRGLESTYGATMGALGSQQEALSMDTGRGLSQATQDAGQAMRKSNMAFSGTVTQGLETQKKQLFQDYAAGTKDIARQRGTALETLTLGKDTAGLDLKTGTYAEQKRQMDEYWEMIGLRQAAG